RNVGARYQFGKLGIVRAGNSQPGGNSAQQFLRNIPAVLRDLFQHLLLQPDVHSGGIILIATEMQLGCELLPRRQAAIHADEFH
ncbi:MAG TPA: hypothetical protein VM717_03165, partial [Chthoniobacterales bacterium]|nr:hypothetical protein [Chthoniobacterales bacterium]